MKKKLGLVAAILVVFVVADWLQEVLYLSAAYRELYEQFPFYFPESLKSLLQVVLVIAAISWLRRIGPVGALREIGLLRPPHIGFLFALLACLPLWLVFAIVNPLAESFPVAEVFYLSVLSPLAEEVVYRGFAFGQLRRLAGWGFWPAALLPAAIFGWGHAEGSGDLGTGLAIFLITGVGSVLAAWFYERWGFNLWVPFFLHCLMNLAWNVFTVGESAFAGWLPTVLQVTTLGLAALLTIFGARRFGQGSSADQAADDGAPYT